MLLHYDDSLCSDEHGVKIMTTVFKFFFVHHYLIEFCSLTRGYMQSFSA
uniref:Uncharacterized protein n=1 Tax=Arundo donax TaxID=35708 RepID=A0A0A9BYX3_ARUDO